MKWLSLIGLLACCAPESPQEQERHNHPIHLKCFNPDGTVRFEKNVWIARPIVERGSFRDVWSYDMDPITQTFFTNGPCETTGN